MGKSVQPMDPTPLVERIESRKALIGVMGLGYVGLPVSVTLAEAGFQVVGVDPESERVEAVMSGRSYLRDIPAERIAAVRESDRLVATTSSQRLAEADAVLICVPTPLAEGIPDMSAIVAAGRDLGAVLSPGSLVVLESTTYPGATEEILQPLLEAGGLAAGSDFLLAYSPERIDPGNSDYDFRDIPKVVGGVNRESAWAAEVLYSQVVPKVVTVSGTREAEMAKLIENTYRHVNIALVNELALYAADLGVDIWEAIGAAATKPFGFQPFWPGPGWGGHCIPLDPSYLSWRVRRDRSHEIHFIELAHTVNAQMPIHVVDRTTLLLNDLGKPLRGSKIMGIGVSYKGGTEDTRGSPGLKVLRLLADRGAVVSFHDPLVSEAEIGGKTIPSTDLSAATLGRQDLVVVLIPQEDVDWELVGREASLVLDCANVLQKSSGKVVRL